MKRYVLIGLAALAVAVTSIAPAQAAKSKCASQAVAYVVSGKVVSGALTRDAGMKTYSGTMTVHVAQTSDPAEAAKGQTTTYALSHAHVTFSVGVSKTAPVAGARVTLKGKITQLQKNCSQAGFTPTVAIAKVTLHRA